jgi:anti-sigma regulatory factor (Ser/Thr protein kinase)
VRQQQAQALERERLAHELQLARLIQQTLLPKELPKLPGWELAVHYQPARAVGGDFYDFMVLPDGRLFLTVGDVTDKGMPAALVMASIRAILRGNARRSLLPSAALQRANELLHPEIPAYMFVTCLYALLDPSTGRLQYANAGHNLPYRKRNGAVSELQATGMPLGLMPGVRYEEQETTLAPGECLVFYSDGLVEAHGPAQDMFGFPRLQQLVGQNPDGGPGLIRSLLTELESFTGPGWEQEDDVTVLTLQRSDVPESTDEEARKNANMQIDKWPVLLEFVVSSEAGNERIAMDRVAEAAAAYFAQEPLERLKTAVAEAVLNGIEHGNQYQAELPVQVQLLLSPAEDALAVRVTDRGIAAPIPEQTSPDLDAKLAELDTPRGWGLFLIRSMVDEMHVFNDETEHRLELILYR